MMPPIRKKLRPYTKDEINYICTHNNAEVAQRLLAAVEEFDLPAVDKLERKIEETFTIIEGKPLEIYKKFINLTDQFNILFKKYSPCKRGCGGCCIIPVQISELEKNIIKNYLEKNNEIKKYIYKKNPDEPIVVRGTNCPFLENNECKIYSVRPYPCRRYISVDEECYSKHKPENEEELVYTSIHIYSNIYYERIINYYYNKKNINKMKLYDIRDFFNKL
jgi:Fe-S-cluster containining protein